MYLIRRKLQLRIRQTVFIILVITGIEDVAVVAAVITTNEKCDKAASNRRFCRVDV